MFFLMILAKLGDWLIHRLGAAYSCYTKVGNYGFFSQNPSPKSPQSQPHSFPTITRYDFLSPPPSSRSSQTSVCNLTGTLLRTQNFFPFFMLVAFEGGGILRSLLLLLSYPFSRALLDYELRLRLMIFITFAGLKSEEVARVSRAVLPKFYLENLNRQVYEVMASTKSKVVLTSVPRVLVEGFVKDYLKFDEVFGTELQTVGGYFTGFLSSGVLEKHRALKEYFGDRKPDIGIGGSDFHDYFFISQCKEAYVVTEEERKSSARTAMPRDRYPTPLVFHDGRLAFLPTPLATLSMFMWLPLGIILAVFRLFVGIYLPYNIAILLGSLSGVNIRIKGQYPNSSGARKRGVLFVCTHRTLLDPVFLSTSLAKPLTAVTYSLSKMSEIISPIRTVRLTRDRRIDGETMERLLSEGDLVVCPEGTTCREPYLLRFSSLFAELADEIVPVAMNTHVTMFYGTTASGLKCLDPIFFLMNPRPTYHVHILEKLPREWTCAGGKNSHEVANYIQRQLADALGFECTSLTRRDKYLMLAGNEGIVPEKHKHLT